MKRSHPQFERFTALAWLFAAIGFAGCQSQPGTFSNPFARSPTQVPPPATRTLLPGQAQPYYPGDPLPSMQSATQAAPRAAVAVAAQQVDRSVAAKAAPSRASVAFSNESSVAIPSDGDPLRFALPPPEKESPAMAAQAPQQNASSPAAAPNNNVSPAIFNQPIVNSSIAAHAAPTGVTPLPFTPRQSAAGPWRSPQIARQSPPPAPELMPTPIAQPQYVALAPLPPGIMAAPVHTVVPNTVGVRLRAVPSPPTESTLNPAPRIRLPGYPAPPNASGIDQASYLMPVVAPGMQTVQITQLPLAAMTAPPASIAQVSGDGFRPRGTMR
jgi:hypothetical protein